MSRYSTRPQFPIFRGCIDQGLMTAHEDNHQVPLTAYRKGIDNPGLYGRTYPRPAMTARICQMHGYFILGLDLDPDPSAFGVFGRLIDDRQVRARKRTSVSCLEPLYVGSAPTCSTRHR